MKKNLNPYQRKAHGFTATVAPNTITLAAGFLSLLLLVLGNPASAQTTGNKSESSKSQQLIKGVVKSQQDNMALVGVSVMVKGTNTGVLTDDNGKFELLVDRTKNDILTFTYVGMKPQEYTIPENGAGELDIKLNIQMTLIEELVVTGAGSSSGPYTEKKSGLRNVWSKVKAIF